MQDSYSGAHAWREDSVYEGDPTAPVLSLHVFTPAHVLGIDDGRNTHWDEFDRPPVESGTTRAAVEATYRMLKAHETRFGQDPEQAGRTLRAALEPMLRATAAGVTVHVTPSREWAAERDRRLTLERAAAPAGRDAGVRGKSAGQSHNRD
ncbi:hypothetical protein GCM10009789_60240 [Kribbella sancticallisti]|uniref:Uncharacterized protein n=1 Tax=Kribbella sancticallisti TaxID=460087 RepID=A0ABP4Q3Y3_9ACTN